ncbi:MAG: hypothetical protein GX591_02310 [Planctomycetes bacterium]|nr:hypothetical protein [Planctomycetota bacterium]
MATSMRDLARRCGVAEGTVRKWTKSHDWAFSLAPPWDVAKVKAWREIHRHGDPAAAYRAKAMAAERGLGEFRDTSALTKARLQATIERALLLRQRRLVEAGQLHDVKECERRRVQQIMEVRNRLMELPKSMAPVLVGLPAERIEDEMTDAIVVVLEEFAGGADAQDNDGGGDEQD